MSSPTATPSRTSADNHKYAPDPVIAAAIALKAGVDNECNTATLFDIGGLGNRYRQAYERGFISKDDIDLALVRLFSARYRNGDLAGLAGRPPIDTPAAPVTTPQRDALALESAEKSLVLLKNDGVLPLKDIKRIAVIGPHADATRVLRGNYSSQLSSPPVSLVDGLRRALPDATVTLVPWSPSITDGDPIPTSALRSPDGQARPARRVLRCRRCVAQALCESRGVWRVRGQGEVQERTDADPHRTGRRGARQRVRAALGLLPRRVDRLSACHRRPAPIASASMARMPN